MSLRPLRSLCLLNCGGPKLLEVGGPFILEVGGALSCRGCEIDLKCRCCGFSAWNCWLCVVLRGSRILRGAPCSRVLRGAPCSRRGEVAPRDGRGGARPPGDEGREVVGDRDLCCLKAGDPAPPLDCAEAASDFFCRDLGERVPLLLEESKISSS